MSQTIEKAERLAKEMGLLFFRGFESKPTRSGGVRVREVFWVATSDGSLRLGPASSVPTRCASWLVKNEASVKSALAQRRTGAGT